MSSVFVPQHIRGSKGPVTQETIQKLLDENSHLIQCITENQSKGKVRECVQYQQILHRNLVWLATVADSNQSNVQGLLAQTSPKGLGTSPIQQHGGNKSPSVRTPPNSSSPKSTASSLPPPPTQHTPISIAGPPKSDPMSSQLQAPQMYPSPHDPNVPMQPRGQHQPQFNHPQQMQPNYQGQYPPAGYSQSPNRHPMPPPMRAQMEPRPPMLQQSPAPAPMPPYSQHQGMMMQQGNPVMMSNNPQPSGTYPPNPNMSHQPPVSYPTSQGMPLPQQHYAVSSNQAMMPDQRQMPHYGRPGIPPGQEQVGYAQYPTNQHVPQYQQQQQQQAPHPDYSQYNNQQAQVPYQQYSEQ